METYKADIYFDFNKLKLSQPVALSGNSYFTSLSLLNGNPILIQTPHILTKNGFVKSAKKNVCDLVFDSECSECIQWFENLETNCYRLLHEQSSNWFQNTLELDDIENAFSPSLKSYKSGKCQICRCNVSSDFNTQAPKTKIYDENELPVSYEHINDKTKVIILLEVRGIKFTTRSFQLDFDIRQMMIVAKNEELDKCLIKRSPDSTIPIGIPIGKNGIQMGVTSKNKQKVVEGLEEMEEMEEVEEVKTEQKDLDDVEEVLMIEDKAPDSNQSDTAGILGEISKTEETLQDISDELQPWDTSKVEDMEDVITTNNLKKDDTLEEKPEIEIKTKPLDSIKDITTENSEIITQPVIPESNTIELELQEIEIADPIFDLSKSDTEETIKIKTPNDVYHELYKNAKQKARKAKEEALQAIMEANSIKNTYMLDEIDESDLSDFDEDDEDDEEDDQEEQYQGETLTIH
jgi:hypothetical protein